ncbi:hypothetical protein CMUS01_13419 [Colletotrichum musicola]|uniref:Uncharacterized protein n=1 Tax=Colletotrichum musicola TaxID=2175873 RepID=A0A8H6JCM7_9PEZI|nr:hypothetical protein CMUS01_13419 [Colletotrichum musicola]
MVYYKDYCELLVWYLWLVLPFWQEVQGITREVGKYSSFL